jgi:iron complex outermembrane recepter protein
MSRIHLMSGVAAVACLAVAATAASAQPARDFNIPAGPLRGALTAFGAQSEQQIFFTSAQVEGRTTAGARGRMTAGAALDRLLAGSGLTWTQPRPGVYSLVSAVRSGPDAREAAEVEDVIVTGTLLRRSGELASPVLMLDRDALDSRGRGTVAEALTDLPQNYAGSGTPGALLSGADRGGSNGVAATGVNLRGLGVDATLVLVNGRRLAGTGFRGEFADVSALPSAAVERVDVLLDGASALYNGGPSRVARLGRVPDIAETRDYVATVIECFLALSAGQGPRSSRQCRSRAAP